MYFCDAAVVPFCCVVKKHRNRAGAGKPRGATSFTFLTFFNFVTVFILKTFIENSIKKFQKHS